MDNLICEEHASFEDAGDKGSQEKDDGERGKRKKQDNQNEVSDNVPIS